MAGQLGRRAGRHGRTTHRLLSASRGAGTTQQKRRQQGRGQTRKGIRILRCGAVGKARAFQGKRSECGNMGRAARPPWAAYVLHQPWGRGCRGLRLRIVTRVRLPRPGRGANTTSVRLVTQHKWWGGLAKR